MANLYTLGAKETINQKIFRVLRQEIVTCALSPGQFLSEKDISVRFKVSRQPVREAFIKLAETGLLHVLPQRGTFVSKISVDRVSAGRFIREAVEAAVARRAARDAAPEYLVRMEQTLQMQKLLVDSNDASAFLLLDDEFHRLIAQSIQCELAWKSIEHIKTAMDRVRFLSLNTVCQTPELIEQHYEIFRAIQAQDGGAAEKSMRNHLQAMAYFMSPIIQSRSDWFTDQ